MRESLKVKEFKLSNGITVWLNEDTTQPKIFGALVVKAGSKDCPNTGIAHYFEHMMFKGTDKIGTTDYHAEKPILDSIAQKYDCLAITTDEETRKKLQTEINELSIKAAQYAIPNEFDRLTSTYGGSQLNAGTSYDFTVYFNQFSPQFIEQWAALNSERLINPVFRLFQSELETVYEEKNMLNDTMGALAMEKLTERFFSPHPYAYPIIGSSEHLKNPQLSQMQKFFDKHYVSSNMGLILSGNFQAGEILPILETYFSRVKQAEAPKKALLLPPPFKGRETMNIKFPIPLVKMMAMGFRGVPANHKDQVALNIAIGLLNNENSTGYLDRLAVEQKLLGAQTLNQSLNDAGLLAIIVMPKLMFQSYNAAEKLVWKEIDRIKNGDFSNEAFQSFKLEQKRNLELSLEDFQSRTTVMMTLYSQGKHWNNYLEEAEQIDKLTKEDIMKVARKYFSKNYLVATKKTGNYPKNKLPKPNFSPILPGNAEATSEYSHELEKLQVGDTPTRFIDFDKDVTITSLYPLVTLYSNNNPINDIFTFTISYKTGIFNNPILSHLATYLPYLGTQTKSFTDFRENLQSRGSTLDFEAKEDQFIIQITGFDKHFAETIALAGDFIDNVQAEEKHLKQLVDSEKVMRKTFLNDSEGLANALLEKIKYGTQSRYLNKLSLSEVKKLQTDNLMDAFKHVVRTECDIHYCGNNSLNDVSEIVKQHLHLQQVSTCSTHLTRELTTYNKPSIYFLDDPKASQSIIHTYICGTPVSDQVERSVAQLFTSYFGGDMSSLMFQEIREFRSLAYRVKADFKFPPLDKKDKPGSFTTMLSTQNDKTVDALEALSSLIQEMPSKPERVTNHRQTILNNVNHSYPPFRKLAARVAAWKNEGYKDDPNKVLLLNLPGIDMEQIEKFYQKQIHNKPVVYMIVGNKKEIDLKKLSSFARIINVKAKDIYR